MKVAASVLLLLALLSAVDAGRASPIEKVLQLLSDQRAKITKEGAEAKRLYQEASQWCVSRSEELKFEIKTGKATSGDLTATIDQEAALIAALSTKVDTLSSDISTHEWDLKAAAGVHSMEARDFQAQEKELLKAIDALDRAVGVLEREMRKGGPSMLQIRGATSFAAMLGLLVEASALTSADAEQLTSFLQSRNSYDERELDGDLELGAPAAAAYKGKSSSIIDTLRDLQDRAEAQLEDARKKASKSRHDFELLKQSLEDQLRLANAEVAEAKQGIARSSEKKSGAEGSLAATSKELAEDEAALESLHQDCLTKAQDFEAETKSREDALKAIGEATKILQDTSGGAADATYSMADVSFIQVSRSLTVSTHTGSRIVHLIRHLAHSSGSLKLSQLASRVSSVLSVEDGEDPFAKVKGLISNMLARLQSEADADATQKAYCDKETKETTAKKEDKEGKERKIATQIEQMSARSAQLKAEVALLQKGLAALSSSQAEMDKLRQEEKTLFTKTKADLELGLEGVKRAMKILRDFYGNADGSAGGAGGGIIALLEVVESDFSKNLAEAVAAEEKAQSSYTQETRQNQVEKAAKEQDVAYKTKESTSLDKTVADATTDHLSVKEQLDAVNDYLAKLNAQCVGKAESHEAKAARRQNEIGGLKQALEILQDDAVLLQRSSGTVRRVLRGIRRH